MCPSVVQRADKMVMHNQTAIAKARIPAVGGRSGRRIYIEDVYPLVDAGRFPVKRIIGEPVDVWADILRDGHAVLAAELLWRPEASHRWSRAPMRLHDNDRWTAIFTPPSPGRYLYAIEAWTDLFATWRRDFLAKRQAGMDVKLEIEEGRSLLATMKPRDAAQTKLIREIWRTSTSADEAGPLLLEELAAAALSPCRTILRAARTIRWWRTGPPHGPAPGTK